MVEVTRTDEGKTKQNKQKTQKEKIQKRTKVMRALIPSGDLLQRWDEVSELSQVCL